MQVSAETAPVSAGPSFVTATLPPTRQALSLPTQGPNTNTPDPSRTETPVSSSNSGACNDSVVLVEDVTVPDNAQMPRGETFTKTWRFLNNGKCNWSGYTIAFAAGDRMNAPDTTPIPQTDAGKTVDVSVQLTAPSLDGSYTGYYEIHNADGEVLPIGIESAFWVKILIGIAVAPTTSNTTTGSTAVTQPSGPASCTYTASSSYQNQIASLINNARTQNGLPALAVNAQLTAAAQGHSIDMACYGFLGHTGSDGSSINQRVVAAGYAPSYSEEIIFGSGFPQTAFDWWMSDQTHRNAILNPRATELGVGYAYNADTAHGGYYTVDFGSR